LSIPIISRANFDCVWKHKSTVSCTDWGKIEDEFPIREIS
jgi:hypothetical protein